MKCINCIYYPCLRIECGPKSNCDYFKSFVEEELTNIDNRAVKLEGRWSSCLKKENLK